MEIPSTYVPSIEESWDQGRLLSNGKVLTAIVAVRW